MVALIAGIIFIHKTLGIYLVLFGVGHTISDLKDMIELKFYSVDEPGEKRFWGID